MKDNEKHPPSSAVTHETVTRKLVDKNAIPATAIFPETIRMMMMKLAIREIGDLVIQAGMWGCGKPYTRPEGEAGRFFDRIVRETLEERQKTVETMVDDAGGFKAPVAVKLGISMTEINAFLKGESK